MVAQGEADALVAERVWQELARGLMERRPSRMFEVLAECGAAAVVVLPELAGLSQVSRAPAGSAALDAAAERGFGLAERFALIAMHAEERAIETLCERLRVPQESRELALLAARYCADVRKAGQVAGGMLPVALTSGRTLCARPERFAQLLKVCAVAAGKPASEPAVRDCVKRWRPRDAVDAGAVAKGCSAVQIKERVAQARIDAITKAVQSK